MDITKVWKAVVAGIIAAVLAYGTYGSLAALPRIGAALGTGVAAGWAVWRVPNKP